MNKFGDPATPLGGDVSSAGDDDQYAMWDAAYVLGSLSSSERHHYEAHLSSCASCREAVSQLSGMPALLSRLDRDEVAAIDDGNDDSNAAPPELLTPLLQKMRWRRRRTRLAIWTSAAAAAVAVVAGVFIALQSSPGTRAPAPQQDTSAVAMRQMTPSAFTATVSVKSQAGGTLIDMSCTYGEPPADAQHGEDQDAGDKLAMVAVGRDGSHDQVATWVAVDGTTATPSGYTSMPVQQIAAIEMVSADTGEVYLQRDL
jgi:hypothetical protein